MGLDNVPVGCLGGAIAILRSEGLDDLLVLAHRLVEGAVDMRPASQGLPEKPELGQQHR